MNGTRHTEEIDRAKEDIGRLADCLKSRRVRAFSRERLLRLQTDLSVLMKQLGEVQRVVSVSMIQRGAGEPIFSEAHQAPAPAPIPLRLAALEAAADEHVEFIDSMPLDWK